MSLRVWLVLFIVSMAVSAEALAWAVQHGQFRQVNRARWAPLRPRGGAAAALSAPGRRRPWMLAAILVGLVAMLVVGMNGMVQLVISAFGH